MQIFEKITVAQINPKVGDIEGNCAKIVAACNSATGLIVFPELCITGYPAEDLWLFDGFIAYEQAALHQLAKQLKNPAIIGATHSQNGKLFNAAYLLQNGLAELIALKTDLPNYSIFDDKRYFASGNFNKIFEFAGAKIGVSVCEDIWTPAKAQQLKEQGAELILSINASPYRAHKTAVRHDIVRARARETGLPIVYVNQVGGQDELVFDGGSFAMNAAGEVVASLPEFAEIVAPLTDVKETLHLNAARFEALKLGLKDYVHKNGFKSVVIGLSGGIDSAFSAAIAVAALGAENVRIAILPSRFTPEQTMVDARKMAVNLGLKGEEISIEPAFEAFEAMLAESFAGKPSDLTEENLQSRIRGTILMALSNKHGDLMLCNGNKSEIAVGYFTLYGDSCGAYSVTKDLYKTEIYEMAHWLNIQSQAEIFPDNILRKAPTAELRENQKDSDSLPPYDVLDAILRQLVDECKLAHEVVGFDAATVASVAKLLKTAEYKRAQMPLGTKLSEVAFGRDWRLPITSH